MCVLFPSANGRVCGCSGNRNQAAADAFVADKEVRGGFLASCDCAVRGARISEECVCEGFLWRIK